VTDIPIRPHRCRKAQAAVILNVNIRTIERYLADGKLKWSGKQVNIQSIIDFLDLGPDGESNEEIEQKVSETMNNQTHISAAGWLNSWKR
jgi:hypothetical protein